MPNEIKVHLDAVADGCPGTQTIPLVAAVVLVGFALFRAYTGDYSDALTDVVMAGMLYLIARQPRAYWIQGYKAAGESVREQVNGVDER